jgi:hypothetical protein
MLKLRPRISTVSKEHIEDVIPGIKDLHENASLAILSQLDRSCPAYAMLRRPD